MLRKPPVRVDNITGMSPPAPVQSFNGNFSMHTSNQNHFSIPEPNMWVPAPNPYFAAYPDMPCPFSGKPPMHPHPPFWFAPPPALVPGHLYMMHQSYACTLPVRSQGHAFHNGSPTPRVPSSQLLQNHTFTPYFGGPVRNSDASLQSKDPSKAQTPKKCHQPERRELHTKRGSQVSTQSARQANHDESPQKYSSRHSDSVPYLQARDSLEVQTPTEVAVSSDQLQAEDANSSQNHSLLLCKASIADDGSTSVSGACSQNEKAPNEEAKLVESEIAYHISTKWIADTKSANLEDLPSDESVFYKWWEFTPPPSPEQLSPAWLGLGSENEEDELSQVLSNSSNDTPSSPQSVLETIHPLLEWLKMLRRNFDYINHMRFRKVKADYDAEAHNNACLEELNKLTKELAKNKEYMGYMLAVAGRCPEAFKGTNFFDVTCDFVHS